MQHFSCEKLSSEEWAPNTQVLILHAVVWKESCLIFHQEEMCILCMTYDIAEMQQLQQQQQQLPYAIFVFGRAWAWYRK